MRIAITGGGLSAEIETFGAELKSLKRAGTEYLWQGNPAIWADSAPFLFPVVARQLEDSYTLRGKTYHMPMHGFAKAREFTVTARSENSVTMSFTEDSETLGWYPFSFRVTAVFTVAEGRLEVSRAVENRSAGTMPFSLGEHPGYNVPMTPGEALTDYVLEFSAPEKLERWYLNDEIICGSEPGPEGTLLPVTPSMFDRGALIFKAPASDAVTLRSTKSGRGVRVEFADYDYLGIWAKPAAPYVCIEPWNGLASSEWSSRDILQKEGIRFLRPGKTARFVMTVRPF